MPKKKEVPGRRHKSFASTSRRDHTHATWRCHLKGKAPAAMATTFK